VTQDGWLGLKAGEHLSTVLHPSGGLSEFSQWFSHDDSITGCSNEKDPTTKYI